MTQIMHSPYHISDLPLSSGLHTYFMSGWRISAIACNLSFRCLVNTSSLLLQVYLSYFTEDAPLFLSLTSALSPFFLCAECRPLLMQR